MSAVRLEALRAAAAAVPDPELPVVTVGDLGVLRDVRVGADGAVEADITPTYSGCPATASIAADVAAALRAAGATEVLVRTVLAPAWSTDDITAAGRRRLAAAGIAPPPPPGGGTGPRAAAAATAGPVPLTLSVRCPQCGSPDTREVSRFGATACTSLWVCAACREPFDRVKPL